MGNRANFVIVKDQDWQLYYSHWGGCRMLDALIGGPDLALRYAASLRRCEKNEWCDPTWADGGRWSISTVDGCCSSASR